MRLGAFIGRHRRLAEVLLLPPITAGGFYLLGRADLMADVPLWVLVVALGGGAALTEAVRVWRPNAFLPRVALLMGVSTFVMYATGWGPMLAIGYMYGVASSVRSFGSRAAYPAASFAFIGIGLGQIAIALDWAPTLVDEDLAHGLSVLGGLGLAFPSWVIYATAERKEASEAELVRRAFYDPITQLPNRTLFVDRLGRALHRSRVAGAKVAVLFVDLDRFKVVNDSLGHEVGDLLLAGVAERISACVRPGDTVGRLGGDEFTVLLEDVSGEESAIGVAERIREELRLPFVLAGYEVVTGASVGIAVGDADMAAETLLRHADVAMYQAKRRGGSRHEVFDAHMGAAAMRRLDIEGRLRRAIDDREFALHFQPEVGLGDGVVVGAEALVRWSDPDGEIVPLEDVIPIAEETGLIVPLGRWVLEEACRVTMPWFSTMPVGRPAVVAVNISARQFHQPDVPDQISAILGATGIDPARVRMEITESAVMYDAARSAAIVEELKTLGVQIAIDDFGTGYSSLSYLSRFPVDVLKLDRSFVTRLDEDDDALAIVDAVVTMAHRLGIRVTAEGVETFAQLGRLRDLGCDTAQGYLFSAPVPVDSVVALFDAPPFEIARRA